ncbi:MAG: 3',5'-cyclic-nucleotide phosphodiesterase [Thiobacillaceae bacterium]|nr:3',5'-cyclic-nucleotide phosphodiesterase [Thiobacillaceae bacterium]
MRVSILGCSGGIGGGRHTTALLVDTDVLIDAGSGVAQLELAALARIEHLFLTHAHLDHILALPLLLDSSAGQRERPLVVHGLPEVLQVLRDCIFNWQVWPDFSRIPSPEAPFMTYAPLLPGETVRLGTRSFTPIPAHHTVPAVGYRLRGESSSLVFSGDTASHAALWDVVNDAHDLHHLIVETSFPDRLEAIARASRHYHPRALVADLARYRGHAPVWITHLKPGGEEEIMREILADAPAALSIAPLTQGQTLELP